MPFLTPFMIALVVSLLLCGLMVWLAPRLRFIDQPGREEHKQHSRSVPYGGGAAMAVALLVAMLVVYVPDVIEQQSPITIMLLGALGLFLLGLTDDIRPLGARWKLIIQGIIVATTVGFADLSLDVIHQWPWLSAFLAFWWCMLLANAYNLMDHADGLSASIAFVSITVLLATALLNQEWHLAIMWLSMLGCLGGFLIWNLPPAKIYMGDAGSLPLGFLIAAGSVHTVFWHSDGSVESNPMAVLTPVLIAMLPIYDMAVVLIKRYRLGRPLMSGDRNHISHRLSRLGLSMRSGLATAVALQVALAASALLLRHQDPLTGVVVVAQAACLLLIAILLEANRDRAI